MTNVALHVRAWVEIMSVKKLRRYVMVALHVRAWVEMLDPDVEITIDLSPSM